MIEKIRLKRILTLALPIIGGMVSQNVLNLVDTAMVGTLGNPALAAVGLGGFATFMCQSLILGISTGVQAMAARRKGQHRDHETAGPLNTGILIASGAGLVLSLVLFFLVPLLYPYLNSDPEVIKEGVPYLRVRVLVILFVGINFSFRGYLNAVDLSRLYMGTLVFMHACNIFLNYTLIYGHFGAPQLGVTGAGVGSSLSTILGTIVYFLLGFRYARANGFLATIPKLREIKDLVRLSLPNGIQQLFFSAGFTAMYWILGKVGTLELAAANVLINITLVAILPGIGLGLSAATLVGQALGREDPGDAARWGWDVVKVGLVGLGALGIPMWLIPDLLLSVFIHDPATLEVARLPMRIVGMTIAFEALGLVLMNALLGAGDSRRVMLVSIASQWFVFLPLAYLFGPVLGFGLLAIWMLQASYRALQAMVFVILWHRGHWASIKLEGGS